MDRQSLRRVMRVLGYGVFFAVLFVACFVWSFPIERFARTVEARLAAFLDRPVTVGDLAVSLTGDLLLYDVVVGVSAQQTSPLPMDGENAEGGDAKPGDEKPGEREKSRGLLSYRIDRITIDFGVIAWLFDELDIEVAMEALGGEIALAYEGPLGPAVDGEAAKSTLSPSRGGAGAKGGGKGTGPMRLFVELREISLKQVHDLRTLLPVPISGDLSFKLEIASETGRFAESSGKVAFSLSSLAFSRAGWEASFFGTKMAVPPLQIEQLAGEIAVDKGEADIASFGLKSKHVEVRAEGGFTLRDPIGTSRLDIYLMFKLLDAYIAKSEALKAVMPDIDKFSFDMRRAHRDDGFFGFRYQGPLSHAKFTPAKTYVHPRKGKTADRGSKRGSARKSRLRRRPSFPRQEVIVSPGEESSGMPERPFLPGPTEAPPQPTPIEEPPPPPPPAFAPEPRPIEPSPPEESDQEEVVEEEPPPEEEVIEEEPREEEHPEEEPREEDPDGEEKGEGQGDGEEGEAAGE